MNVCDRDKNKESLRGCYINGVIAVTSHKGKRGAAISMRVIDVTSHKGKRGAAISMRVIAGTLQKGTC